MDQLLLEATTHPDGYGWKRTRAGFVYVESLILHFNKVEQPEMLYRILQICRKERVTYDASGLEALAFLADGDVRKAITVRL